MIVNSTSIASLLAAHACATVQKMDSSLLVGLYLVGVSVFSALWVMHTPPPARKPLARFASVMIILAFTLFGAIQQVPTPQVLTSPPTATQPAATTTTQSASAVTSVAPPASPRPDASHTRTARIIRVVDGDTIVVQAEGAKETVRLIGIDAPEKQTSRSPAQCFGPEATQALTEMLPADSTVTLTHDPTQDARDRYGRTLAYVQDANGNDVGETLLRNGYAYEYVYRIPYERHTAFANAEKEAHHARQGLWAACDTTR